MAKTMNVMVLALALATSVLMLTEAAQYTVGDELGWTIPPGGAATYAAWAAKHSLTVDDLLTFNFKVGEQDLALVTKEDYASCNTANPLIVSQGPGEFQFLQPDTYYLTCTFAGHCSKGQKITLHIAPSPGSPSAAPAPSAGSETYQSRAAAVKKSAAVKYVSKKAYGFQKFIPPMMMKSL